MSPALAAQSVNHWTAREVLWLISSYILEFVKCLFIQWMLTYFHRRSLSERYYIIIASLQQNVNVTYGLSGLKLCLPSLNFIFSFICVCDVYINRYVKVTQSCLTLCNPLDHIVHGILQARILEWLAVSFSSRFSQPRDWTQVSPALQADSYLLSHKGSPGVLEWVAIPSPADLPDPEIEPRSPALQADSLPAKLPGNM